MDYEQSLNMAKTMQAADADIQRAIRQVQKLQHGVVALQFHDYGRQLEIVILNEPYDDNVRVYPGK